MCVLMFAEKTSKTNTAKRYYVHVVCVWACVLSKVSPSENTPFHTITFLFRNDRRNKSGATSSAQSNFNLIFNFSSSDYLYGSSTDASVPEVSTLTVI